MTRTLIALTSHGRLGSTGRATGYYVPEVAEPWQVFRDADFGVDVASVAGGEPPRDGVDDADPAQRALAADATMAQALRTTPRLADVDGAAYDVVLFAGGHGAMWDLPGDPGVAAVARAVHEAGGVVAAVCHGPAALVGATDAQGRPLVEGRRFAAFTDDEEDAVGLTDVVPFLLASRLTQLGGTHVAADRFAPQVVVDGRLVTGQNPASARPLAEAVVELVRG